MPSRPLDTYKAKREFSRTPEPPPKILTSRDGPPLFCIQKHTAQRLHYDFRLEFGGVLKSWAVPKGPSAQLGDKRLAVETEDHPFDYASFEGVIPAREYGGGNVIVWDCGAYSPDEGGKYSFGNRDEAEARMLDEHAKGKLSFLLRGEKVKGSYALVRTSTPKQWLLLKHKDRFANTGDLLSQSRSVLSGVTVDEIAQAGRAVKVDAERLIPHGPAEPPPRRLDPMLAEIGTDIRSDPRWLYEPKMDGYRVIAYIDNGKVRLSSRRGLDYTDAFPELVADLAAQAVDSMILDGEIVVLDDAGIPSFNALQNRARLKTEKEISEARRRTPAALVCFDLLHFAGRNLRGSPYAERRRYLAQCLLPTPHLQLVHVSANAEQLYAAAIGSGFEGIVAKRKDAIYQPGKRSAAWLKVKARQTAEFVVGGYTKGKGAREPLGAMLLGYWAGGKLKYAGHVGSALKDGLVAELLERFTPLIRKTHPFDEKPPLHRPVTWVEPKVVIEASFEVWTPDGMLRAPVFVRVRDDMDASEITHEPQRELRATEPNVPTSDASGDAVARRTKSSKALSTKAPANEIGAILEQLDTKAKQLDLTVGGARIRLTNLDREYWPDDAKAKRPAVTKRDLIHYLAAVSPFMLPHLRDRPLTMIRMPEGIHGERFFQKHWTQARPDFVETVSVYSDHKSERHAYILANNLPTLLWLGQNGTLEFHIWHSRAKVEPDAAVRSTDYDSSLAALEASVLNYPDYLVFDIDPYVYSGKEAKGAEPELNKKGFAGGRSVAFWLRDLLREMSLEAKVKTSGKTGLHVFVPIDRTVSFEGARAITETVGRHLLRAHPRIITMDWATEKRTGKIFIDHNMNVRGKTLNVAYSPRGVPGAPISMPLTWDELEAAEPMDFRMDNVLQRLERSGDRWHDALTSKQSLTRAFGRNTESKPTSP